MEYYRSFSCKSDCRNWTEQDWRIYRVTGKTPTENITPEDYRKVMSHERKQFRLTLAIGIASAAISIAAIIVALAKQ